MNEETVRRLGVEAIEPRRIAVEAIERALDAPGPEMDQAAWTEREIYLDAMEIVMRVRERYGRAAWGRHDGETVMAMVELLRPLRGLR